MCLLQRVGVDLECLLLADGGLCRVDLRLQLCRPGEPAALHHHGRRLGLYHRLQHPREIRDGLVGELRCLEAPRLEHGLHRRVEPRPRSGLRWPSGRLPCASCRRPRRLRRFRLSVACRLVVGAGHRRRRAGTLRLLSSSPILLTLPLAGGLRAAGGLLHGCAVRRRLGLRSGRLLRRGGPCGGCGGCGPCGGCGRRLVLGTPEWRQSWVVPSTGRRGAVYGRQGRQL